MWRAAAPRGRGTEALQKPQALLPLPSRAHFIALGLKMNQSHPSTAVALSSVRNAAFIFTYVSHIGPSQGLWMGLELLHVPVIMKRPDSWKSAVCDEDLLFKNACGCSICRPSLGRWGWSATSLCLTSRVISPSQRRVRMLLIYSLMGIYKDWVSLSTDGRGACFHGEGGVQGSRGGARGRVWGKEHISSTCGWAFMTAQIKQALLFFCHLYSSVINLMLANVAS